MSQLTMFPGPQTLREQWAEEEATKELKLNTSVKPADVPRLTSALQRILTFLKDGQWHTTTELERVGGRSAPQRVHDLKKSGYSYDCEPIPGQRGEHRWRLIIDGAEIKQHDDQQAISEE